MYNEKLFIKLVEERNVKKSTIRGYYTSLNSYTNFCEMTLQELYDEAIADEKSIVLLKNRRLKQHLIDYRSYLINKNIASSTIKNYMSKITTFYNHFMIEIPQLPQIKYEKSYEISYEDLPSRTDIKKVLDIVPIDFKSLILFMVSSGTAKSETLSLTVSDFLKATHEYHSSTSILGSLNELSNKKDVVPTFYIKRFKTDKYYHTFCTPEATNYIVKYLKTRDCLKMEDKLFPFTDSTLVKKFELVNDYFGWGFKGYYRFFRSHVLRKYHASNIGLPEEIIDELEGRGKNKIHDTYIKTNPIKLKKIYKKYMHNVTIYQKDKIEEEIREEINITINIFLADSHISL